MNNQRESDYELHESIDTQIILSPKLVFVENIEARREILIRK